MVLIGELLNEVHCTGDFHKIDNRRQRNYAARIGIACGLTITESQKLDLEGMTYNKTDICLEDGMKHCVSPTPHCDENDGVEDGSNFLICFSWMERMSASTITVTTAKQYYTVTSITTT
eukprot:scaffold365580_cov35-Attheya_sp.AAC.1